jgi:hypothetical protein
MRLPWVSRVLREHFSKPLQVSMRFWAEVAFRPNEKCFDYVGGAGIGMLRRLRGNGLKLVKLALRLFTVLMAFCETDFLSGKRNHPPAGVLTKPNFVDAWHTKPPVQNL